MRRGRRDTSGTLDVRPVWSARFWDDALQSARVDRDARHGGLRDDRRLRHDETAVICMPRSVDILALQRRVREVWRERSAKSWWVVCRDSRKTCKSRPGTLTDQSSAQALRLSLRAPALTGAHNFSSATATLLLQSLPSARIILLETLLEALHMNRA